MSKCCPYRHASFISWRCLTSSRLFAISGCPSFSAFISQATLISNNCQRRLSSSPWVGAESARQAGTEGDAQTNLQQDLDSVNDTLAAEASGLNDRPFQPARFLQDGREQASRVSAHSSLIDKEGGGHGSQCERAALVKERSNKNKAVKRPRKRRHWSPFDEHGQADLYSLAVSLGGTVESSKTPVDDDKEAPPRTKISDHLPVSPLVKAMERTKARKLSPKGKEEEELANNPWANMLASPVRLCAATGVRLPRDLMVSWGLVKNPATEGVYFVPAELAELDSLKDKRRRPRPSASSSAEKANGAREFLSKSATDSAAFKVDENASKVTKPSPVVYMLPYLPLLHHLTLRFTSLQKDMVTRRSKPNAINSLLPWRLKARMDRASFYAERPVQAPPFSTSKEVANAQSPNSFQAVKWEVDIDRVMLRILRERVLAALEMLGNRNLNLWHQQRELVKAIRATRTSNASDEENSWRLLAGEHHMETLSETDMAPHVNGAQICLLVEFDSADPTLQHAIDSEDDQVGDQGTKPVSNNASPQDMSSSAATNERWSSSSSLEPPTIRLNQSDPVPLFSLNDLFDITYMSRFRYLASTVGVLAPRDLTAGNRNEDSYVLIVPAEAFGGKSVIEEIWRLWRFLGGRDKPDVWAWSLS